MPEDAVAFNLQTRYVKTLAARPGAPVLRLPPQAGPQEGQA